MATKPEELDSRQRSPFETPEGGATGKGLVRSIVWMAVGALAIAVGARVTVSFDPIPMTLQTLAVLGIGGLLGRQVGAGAAVLYLALVLVGLPVLSDGSTAPGSAFLDLKSAGYVVGFIPAAFIAGFAGQSVVRSLIVMALAHGVILAMGTSWLARHIGRAPAIEHGLQPFLWGALVKSVVAAALVQHFAERKKSR